MKNYCLLLVLALIPATSLRAQDPTGLYIGLPPNGVFSGSEFDNVQMNNLNLHIELPLNGLSGRGDISIVQKLVYYSTGWSITWRCLDCPREVKPAPGDLLP